MPLNVSVRFYRVDCRDTTQPQFAACLQRLALLTPEKLVRDVADAVVQMDNHTQSGGLFFGDLIRLQADDLPSLIEPGQKPEALTLPKGKHLGHHTAFIFDPETRMLGYQMNKGSVSMSRFNLFVSDICGCAPFLFKPVLHPAQLQALNSTVPKTFVFKVADPYDLDAVEDNQKELRDTIINLKDLSHGAYVKIQIGMGRVKGELDKSSLGGVVGWLLEQWGRKKGKVRSVKIVGEATDDQAAPILDFLKAHVGHSDSLDTTSLSPDKNFEVRRKFLHGAFLSNLQILKAFSK